jgi:hypothetical protein
MVVGGGGMVWYGMVWYHHTIPYKPERVVEHNEEERWRSLIFPSRSSARHLCVGYVTTTSIIIRNTYICVQESPYFSTFRFSYVCTDVLLTSLHYGMVCTELPHLHYINFNYYYCHSSSHQDINGRRSLHMRGYYVFSFYIIERGRQSSISSRTLHSIFCLPHLYFGITDLNKPLLSAKHDE